MESRFLRGVLAAAAVCASTAVAANPVVAVSEGFEPGAPLTDWLAINLSVPAGQDWFQGNAGIFTAQAGSDDSYIAANFLSAANGAGTIENWVVTPAFASLGHGTLTFWTRTEMAGFTDRLQVRFNSTGSANVADFDQVLLDINAAEAVDGFPTDWTQFAVNYVGVEGNQGRFAIVYRNADAANFPNYVGVDTVDIVAVPIPGSLFLVMAGFGAAGLARRTSMKSVA